MIRNLASSSQVLSCKVANKQSNNPLEGLEIQQKGLSATVVPDSLPHQCFLFSTGYEGHWGHQFSDSSSECLFCPGTDQHAIPKQALLKAVILTVLHCLPTISSH